MREVLFPIAASALVAGLWTTRPVLNAQQSSIKIKPVDIGGVVASAQGPEAGVWGIAETTDLPTRYMVTDDRGRYLFQTCRPAATRSGHAAMDWWIRPRCKRGPGRLSI